MKGGKGGKGKGPGDYDVGYGKPPRHRRFQPGQSGNPKGRPKRARGKHRLQDAILQRARETFLDEAKRKITVREGERVVTMEAYRLAVRAAFMSAAKGSAMAQRTVIQTTMGAEAEIAEIMGKLFHEALMYKEECELKRRRCRKAGLAEPVFRPNPDDIAIDWESLTVEYQGPLASQLKANLTERLRLRDEWEDDFQFTRERYEEDGRSAVGLLLAIQSQRNHDIMNESLPPRYRKPLAGRLTEREIDEACWRTKDAADEEVRPSGDG